MKTLKLALAALLLSACSETLHLKSGDEMTLDQWTLNQEGSTKKYEVSVPSTVAGALFEAGEFGNDLLESRNYASFDKTIFDKVWTYKTDFALAYDKTQNYELTFNGLNYYADIFVNGTQIAAADTTYGVFIRRVYDVTDLLKSKNEVEVRIRRAQSGDLNIGFVDWNPRPLDESMGITQTVVLSASGAADIDDVFVIPDLDTETFAEADLEVRVTLKNNRNTPVEGNIVLDIQDGGSCSVPVSLEACEERIVSITPEQAANLHIDNPRVWWSWELGSPELYEMNVKFETEGAVSDTENVTFGVREFDSYLNEY